MFLFDKTEIEDFNKMIKKHGYQKNDFKIEEKNLTDFKKSNPAPILGEVTIYNKKTGKNKTYKSGTGSTWVVEAENDLIKKTL